MAGIHGWTESVRPRPGSRTGRAPNTEGVSLERVDAALSDRDLIERAADGAFAAVVFLEPEVVSQKAIRELAMTRGVTLMPWSPRVTTGRC